MKQGIFLRGAIVLTAVAFALLLQFTHCRPSLQVHVPRGDRDTLILNCDTIIMYRKFKVEKL